MWQLLARSLLASLEKKGAQQVVSKILGKNTSFSFLNLVKNNYKRQAQKVDYLFNRKLRIDALKRALRKPVARGEV